MVRLIAGRSGWAVGEYRDNAQAICREYMFGEVVKRPAEGDSDCSNIQDGYGSTSLRLRSEPPGFRVLSDLRHHSQVDLHFGMAGLK
ncbi:MAG: hypothetical protein AAGD07_09945 [Planctomycetota bacterium]